MPERRRGHLPARSAALDGVLTMVPLLAAYIPFALVIGAAVAEHGSPVAGWAGSWLIYGGSAHLAAIRTLDEAGPVVAITTALLINARLLVYSASLARRWTAQPRWFRFAAAGLIIDPTWAAAERHAGEGADPDAQRRYFIAAGLTLGTGWSAAIAAGAALGSGIEGLDVEIVIPLCLMALIGPALRSSIERTVVVSAAAVALLTAGWPAGTGLLAAISGRERGGCRPRAGGGVMTWLVILAVGAGSFLFRLVPLLVLHRVSLPEGATASSATPAPPRPPPDRRGDEARCDGRRCPADRGGGRRCGGARRSRRIDAASRRSVEGSTPA